MAMRDAIKVILESRLDTTIQRGRIGTFVDANGGIRTVLIERINHKTVSCIETGVSIKPGSKWRCSKVGLTVLPILRVQPLAVSRPLGSYKPSTGDGDTW